MISRAVPLAAACLAAVACTNHPPDPPTPPQRQAILGTPAPSGECTEPSVVRKKNVPTAELTIQGREGDTFTYEITKTDGSRVAGDSGPFTPGQSDVVFTTGIPNSEIRRVTIHATSQTGETDQCVITTIQ